MPPGCEGDFSTHVPSPVLEPSALVALSGKDAGAWVHVWVASIQ
jgi:hypothetical protein